MVSCGTSVVVAGASELSVPVAGIVTFPLSRGVSVHAGPTQAGGDALRWWSRVSGSPIEDVVAEAAKSSPGAGGVVFTPHLMGERAPLWDSDVRGSFFGLSADTTRSDLARAVLEGVAMSARQVLVG
jgi:xylulokinase